jgi:hypothetical protein
VKQASKSTRKPKLQTGALQVLYLYAISQVPERTAPVIAAEGIDGASKVEAMRCQDFLCWISRVSKAEFADQLTEHMQDLEWLASAGLRHQRVVSELSEKLPTLPARFGIVFLGEESLAQHVKKRELALREAFERVANADEWGVKVFALARPKTAAVAAVSGSDYLKRKSELLQPSANKLDDDVREFVSTLTKLSAATAPGGKASAGQPGLVWHGSFLVRGKDRKKLESALKKYAAKWDGVRRIDYSGPWPPYSFVGEHVY